MSTQSKLIRPSTKITTATASPEKASTGIKAGAGSTDLPGDAVEGHGSVVPQWTRMNFTFPCGGVITVMMAQESQTVFQAASDTLPVWSPPYPSGSVYLSYEEIIALPSADAFFGELFVAADAKLALANVPPEPPPPENVLDNTLPTP